MTAFNEKLAALSPEKRALLEARLIGKRTSPVASRRADGSPAQIELSFAQKSMWFLDRLEPLSSFYSIPQAMRICGELNIDALRKSFTAVIARHEVLRTQIVAVDAQPQPRLSEAALFDLPVVEVPLGDRKTVREMMDAEARRPFDLEKDLMLRARLLRLDEREHILLLTVHHIASDLWSFSVFYRELAAFYEAFIQNTDANLPPLQFQYSDFARAQREFLQSANCSRQLEFWRKQLAGDLPELNLPVDRTRTKSQRFRGARASIEIDVGISQRLKILGQTEGATLYITLLAAFQTLLHRYTGQDDIIVGSPIGGRNSFDTENLIGYFLNVVALRTDLSGDPTFCELLRRSREAVHDAFANREIPFEKLVDELRIPRNGNQNPVFQTIFQFQPGGVPVLQLKNTKVQLLESDSGTSKMDLVFTLAEGGDCLFGNLEYNTDLFEAATIRRMLNHFQRLLKSIAENPGQKISRLSLIDSAEREQVLFDFNKTETSFPRDKSISQLFEEQVGKTPDATALVFNGQELTYHELNRRADQLAVHLRESGVGPGSLVGICLERSFELIAGLLAILKAGAAYVPLDANLPEERLQFMLDDTGVSVLITDKNFSFSNARKVNPRSVPDFDVGRSMLDVQHSPKNLAYVMYTSGSTGKPKGVAIPQRAVVRLVKETNFMRFSADEVFLQFAPVSFDASTLEIWGSLLNGAKLVIHPSQLPSLEELGQTLRENKITTLWLTAGLFHQMVEHQIESLRGVKQLLAGGDVLSVAHVKKVLEQLPDCQLINGYGPTENTTFTCCYPVPKNWRGERSVPIGKPISNTQVYILDKHLEPVPIGVPGELFIGGDGLARGYLNAPELNAEKFISLPGSTGHWPVPSGDSPLGMEKASQLSRMPVANSNVTFVPSGQWPDSTGESPVPPTKKFLLYKTGDQARWLADGNVEFLGRLDHQIKLRGFRIELGEIEAAIHDHPLVRQAVVIARENSAMDKQLVAYLTKEPSVSLAEEELRNYLEQTLPHYMVPSCFVWLEEFPLTQNGKIDRRRLPAPETSARISAAVAPGNETEQKLFNIWSEVLGRSGFGVRDNFFQLGGHSLLATRIASRIVQQFQIEFSLRQIFECPTISALARVVQSAEGKSNSQPQLKRRASRERPAEAPVQHAVFSNESCVETFVSANNQAHANVS